MPVCARRSSVLLASILAASTARAQDPPRSCVAIAQPRLRDAEHGVELPLTPDRFELRPREGRVTMHATRDGWLLLARDPPSTSVEYEVIDPSDGRVLFTDRASWDCSARPPPPPSEGLMMDVRSEPAAPTPPPAPAAPARPIGLDLIASPGMVYDSLQSGIGGEALTALVLWRFLSLGDLDPLRLSFITGAEGSIGGWRGQVVSIGLIDGGVRVDLGSRDLALVGTFLYGFGGISAEGRTALAWRDYRVALGGRIDKFGFGVSWREIVRDADTPFRSLELYVEASL